MKNITLVLLAAIALLGCNSLTTSSSAADWQTHSTEEFEIKYPKDWSVTPNAMGTAFVLFKKADSNTTEFAENINLFVQDLSQSPTPTMTLDEYSSVSINQIKTILQDGKLVSNERKKSSSDQEYEEVVFTSQQNDMTIQFIQNYYVQNGKAYVLTYSVKQGEYEEKSDFAKNILATLTLK